MKRREFVIKSTIAGAALAFAPGLVFSNNKGNRNSSADLILLHTNDVHSRIDPFPNDDPKYAGKGGVAKRMTLIEQIREKNKHVLLFDCGDVFQGTPYFNLFGGEAELKAMSLMKYDAGTMGNHDFDNGIDGFLNVLPNAKFPFICSNYDFSKTVLKGKTRQYSVFSIGKIKIGVIGIGIELDGLVSKSLYKETLYLDPIKTADEYGNMLKNELKCDMVVCLSHLGFSYENDKISDKVLASNTSYIDVILGGHTHTFLNEPFITKNAKNKPVIINQVGWGGINLGYLKFNFFKKITNEESVTEISYIAEGNREIA